MSARSRVARKRTPGTAPGWRKAPGGTKALRPARFSKYVDYCFRKSSDSLAIFAVIRRSKFLVPLEKQKGRVAAAISKSFEGNAAGFEHGLAALLFELYGFRNSSGSLAIFAAIRRAASRVR